jgi:WD40 repeat protein
LASNIEPSLSSSDKLKVFVSYARAEMKIADDLVLALKGLGIEVTIDRSELHYGEQWQLELAEFIRRSDTVLWLLSPASIASQWCSWELGEVIRLNKRLVPVRVAPVKDDTIPAYLGKIHMLPAVGTFSMDRDMSSLLTALSTNVPWLKKHTSLGERATAWVNANRRKNDLLLRGLELEEAEAWIGSAPSVAPGLPAAPEPTGLHREFIIASRMAQDQEENERTKREQAARIARGYEFSSRAQLAIEGKCFDRGLRLAMAGISLSQPDMPEALFEDVVDAARGSRLKLEIRPESGVAAATVTPDLRLAAVLASDGALTVWNTTAARLVATTEAEGQATNGLSSAAIDAHGKRILVARPGAYADVVDVETGKVLRRLGPHVGTTVRVGLVDGTPFGFSTEESITGEKQYFALTMWNIATGERLYTIDDFSSRIDTVLIHPSRSVFVTNHWSDECLAWDVVSGKRVRSLSAHSIPAVRGFSQDGRRYLAPGNNLLSMSVHDWDSDALLCQLKGHAQYIRCVCWSPDGKRIATGDGDGVVGLWNATNGERYDWFMDPSAETADGITALSFTGDGEGLIVATGTKAAMTLWNLKDKRVATVIHGHQAAITDIQMSVDGLNFCSVAAGEAVRVWTLEDYPHSSAPTVSLPQPSRAGLRAERFKTPDIEGFPSWDRSSGVRIFGPLQGRAALDPILARGLGNAEAFTDAERQVDAQLREAPLNPFQALRDSPFRQR